MAGREGPDDPTVFRLNERYMADENATFDHMPVQGEVAPLRMGQPKPTMRKKVSLVTSDNLFALAVIVVAVTVLQVIVGTGSYSGAGRPPMYGDYEAQRHWMEITINLPLQEWYHNTTRNNLSYWGLDYPPLTAYHSYAMGWIARRINPDWVALKTSRGIETSEHKLFMRFTAIVAHLAVYVPAAVAYLLMYKREKSCISFPVYAFLFLAYPGLISIDHGHFQYNAVSLGLFIGAFVALVQWKVYFGALLFVCALNYKQMELYHALPVFFYILFSICHWREFFNLLGPRRDEDLRSDIQALLDQHRREMEQRQAAEAAAQNPQDPADPPPQPPRTQRIAIVEGYALLTLIKVAAVTILTFGFIWSPFFNVVNNISGPLQVLHRLFPFSRGLFEDKVACVWCALSPLFKFGEEFEQHHLVKISISLVLLPCIRPLSMIRDSNAHTRLCFFIVALSFFLFSFQVHEKSILLVAIPALMLLPDFPELAAGFLHVSNTSLYSLCLKDDNASHLFLFIGYFILLVAFVPMRKWYRVYFFARSTISIGLCLVELYGTPPPRYPHLFPFFSAFFSCCCFVADLIYAWNAMSWTEVNRALSWNNRPWAQLKKELKME